MNMLKLLDKLRSRPTFNISDIQKITFFNRNYSKVVLSRLIKRKLIKRITKDSYTLNKNIHTISSNIIFPSYISFWSASSFLGYTSQILNTIQIATTRKAKNLIFENYKIKFIPIKEFFGYRKIKTDEGEILIVGDEKLLIDCFLRPKEMGNFDEINSVFENAKIDKRKLISYLKRTNSQTIIKRVGYLIQEKQNLDLSKEFKLDNNYVLLNPFSKKWKMINTKWRIKK